jgi:hypothetical protein
MASFIPLIDHPASDYGGEEKLSRFEGVQPAVEVRVENDLSFLGGSAAIVRVNPPGDLS